jgi:hypothetical protein
MKRYAKRNTMNTQTQFTIGQEVTFKGAFGVNVITSIKGNKVTTLEKNSNLTYTKMIKSLVPYTYQPAYYGEQEILHMTIAKYNHGATVYSCLDISGVGCRMVWDENKKCIVNHNELS